MISSVCGHGAFYALIIGVADYPGSGNDLAFTDDDAIDVRDALLSYENWPANNVTLLLDADATKENVQHSITDLATTMAADDVFALFFSGHGTTGPDLAPLDEADGIDEYLCTYGSSLDTFIRDDELEGWLASLPVDRILVLIDSCFSGGQFKDVKSLNEGPAPRVGDGFANDLEELVSPVGPQDLDGLTGNELVVLTAADDHEYAYEIGHPYNHGIFSYYLLEAMGGGASSDSGNWISAEASFEYLEPRVVELSDDYGLGQHPQMLDECPGDLGYLELPNLDDCWRSGWKTLQIRGNGAADVELGVAPEGSGCYDVGLDLPAPLPVPGGDYTRAWLQVAAGCSGEDQLERDVQAAIMCGEARTWYLHIEDVGCEESIRISWDYPLFGPDPSCLRQVTLTRWPVALDPVSGAYVIDTSSALLDCIDMIQTGSYTYSKVAEYDHSGFTIAIDCRTCSAESIGLDGPGWHMIALPGELCEPCTLGSDGTCGDLVCALEDDLASCFAYRYDVESGGYSRVPPADRICYRPGMGAWIYATGANTSIDAEVMAIDAAVELALQCGWNQIGNPYTMAIRPNAFSIRRGEEEKSLVEAQTAGWISATLYAYDTLTGQYAEISLDTGQLPPWTGFWLRTFVEGCALVIQPVGATPAVPMTRTLCAEEIRRRDLELPPLPPELGVMTWDADEILETLTVINIPNPIRSEHTTVFRVQGAGADRVDEIRVDIYNQQGMRVFSERVDDIELVWHTVDEAGELLANGVYFYQVWMRIGEIWYPLEVQKLAVVR